MTMGFITAKSNLVTLLGNQAAGRYRVSGYQEKGKSAEYIEDTDRLIEVYYSNGNFPKSGGAMFSSTKHEVTFRLDLSVSKTTTVDLSVLRNPASTEAQRAIALAAYSPAKKLVDASFDAFVDIVYNIVMDSRNQEFGGTKYSIASRWINSISKDEIIPSGEYAVLTGSINLTCNVVESLVGASGTEGDIINVDVETNAVDSGQKDSAPSGVYLDP